MTEAFERIVKVTPAFDKRHPDPSKNYGIHGCNLHFILKGSKGATQFVVFTNWQLPHVNEERAQELWTGDKFRWMLLPQGAEVGYHSPTPQDEDQQLSTCDILSAGFCYYDGSILAAEDLLKRMLAEGSDAVWAELERVYARTFEEYSNE